MNYNMMPAAYAVMADPFAKSPYNPVNMSRTAAKKSSGHAPSARILERVHEAAADLAQLATTAQGWKFVTEKNRAMLYEMNGRALPAAVSTTHTFGAGGGHISDFYLVRAVTTVHANIPAVLDALQARTTEEFAPKMKKIFGKHYGQGVVINELSCTTPPPFAADPESSSGARKSFSDDDAYSVNWLALQGGSSADKQRDFTMVCYQDGFERRDRELVRIGRGALQDRCLTAQTAQSHSLGSSQGPAAKLLGVHVFSSVNFKDIPALPSTSHSDRQHFRNSGFVIEATNDPHAFKLSLFLSLLPTKSSLKHARKYQKWLLSLAAVVGNVGAAVQALNTPELNLSHLGKTAWKKSDHCYICLKMFRTFRRCHHCRLCGEAVCSACSGFVKVSTGRGRSNSQSSVDMRSQYSNDDGGSGSSDDSTGNGRSHSSYQNETRGCTVCIQSVAQSSASLQLSRKSSSSSFSSNSHSQVLGPSSSSVVSMSGGGGTHSEDELSISFGDDSDFHSGGGGGSNHGHSFQSYYDHRKRSTGAMTNTSSNDDALSVASTPSAMATPSSMKQLHGEYNQQHHTTMNTPSMSTTSSSFSRTSHEAELLQMQHYPVLHSSSSNPDLYGQQQTQNQYQRNYMPSFSSEVSYGSGDLSRDPDILALAGLTLKPSAIASSQQQVRSVAEEDYDDFDPAASQRSSGGPRRWSGAESTGSSNSAPAPAAPAARAPIRQQEPAGGSTFHFSVKSSSGSSTSASALAGFGQPAPQKSSVHAEIAALMLEDLASGSSSVSSQQGPYGKPPTASSSMRAPSAAQTAHGGHGNATSRSFNPSASSGSNYSSGGNSNANSSSKLISVAMLSAAQQQQQKRSLANDSANDMILLSAPAPRSPEFVVFDDARRESIFTRPDNGSDMIPLDLLGKY